VVFDPGTGDRSVRNLRRSLALLGGFPTTMNAAISLRRLGPRDDPDQRSAPFLQSEVLVFPFVPVVARDRYRDHDLCQGVVLRTTKNAHATAAAVFKTRKAIERFVSCLTIPTLTRSKPKAPSA
jgi:hypothetical protein